MPVHNAACFGMIRKEVTSELWYRAMDWIIFPSFSASMQVGSLDVCFLLGPRERHDVGSFVL